MQWLNNNIWIVYFLYFAQSVSWHGIKYYTRKTIHSMFVQLIFSCCSLLLHHCFRLKYIWSLFSFCHFSVFHAVVFTIIFPSFQQRYCSFWTKLRQNLDTTDRGYFPIIFFQFVYKLHRQCIHITHNKSTWNNTKKKTWRQYLIE